MRLLCRFLEHLLCVAPPSLECFPPISSWLSLSKLLSLLNSEKLPSSAYTPPPYPEVKKLAPGVKPWCQGSQIRTACYLIPQNRHFIYSVQFCSYRLWGEGLQIPYSYYSFIGGSKSSSPFDFKNKVNGKNY